MKEQLPALRTPLVGLATVAVVVGILPWMSGGQQPVALLITTGSILTAHLLLWRTDSLRHLPRRWTPVLAAILLCWGSLSLVWSVNRYQTVQWIVVWALVMLTFTLAYRAAQLPRAWQWFTRAYLVSTGLMVAYGIYLYLTTSYERFTSSFYWANPAAAYLMPALLLLLADPVTEHKNKLLRWWQPVVVGMIGAAFWLAASRGATLVLLLVSLILVALKARSKSFWTQLILSLVIASIAVITINYVRNNVTKPAERTAPSSVTERLAEAARGEATSLDDRLNYLQAASRIWLDHPATGTGAGTYASVHPRYQERVISASSSAHNVYVQTLSELGPIGALLLVLIVVSVGMGVVQSARHDPQVWPLALGFLALVVHFGLDIDTNYPALVFLAAALAGFGYKVSEVRRGKPSWTMPLLATLLLVPVISLYQSDTWATNAAISQDNGELEAASEWYGKAHSVLVYDPNTLIGEGIAYYALALSRQDRATNLKLALDRAHRAQRQDPYDAQHWFLEGRALALAGRSAEGITAFTRAIERDPYNHPEYYQQLALVQLGQKQIETALATVRRATMQYPDNVLALRQLDPNVARSVASLHQIESIILASRGDTEGAKRSSDQAKRLIESAPKD